MKASGKYPESLEGFWKVSGKFTEIVVRGAEYVGEGEG